MCYNFIFCQCITCFIYDKLNVTFIISIYLLKTLNILFLYLQSIKCDIFPKPETEVCYLSTWFKFQLGV